MRYQNQLDAVKLNQLLFAPSTETKMPGTTQTIPPSLAPYELPQRNRHRAPNHDDEIRSARPLGSTRSITAICSDNKPYEESLLFTSPRCKAEDDEIFPDRDKEALQTPETRWQHISEQAGSHRQDGSLMVVNRNLAPQALKSGVTLQVGRRVRRLNLWLNHTEDILPEWLDVIATTFPNLEHLTLTEDVYPDDENAVSSRMRRLYVLYRLPNLNSIDDMRVTVKERSLARPGDANGNRVQRKEWVKDSLLDNADEDDDVIGDDENDDIQQVHTTGQDQVISEGTTQYETDSSNSDDSNVKDMDGKSMPKELIGISILEDTIRPEGQCNDSEVDTTISCNMAQTPPSCEEKQLYNKNANSNRRHGDAVEVDLSGTVRRVISSRPKIASTKTTMADPVKDVAASKMIAKNDEEKREESPIVALATHGLNAALLAQNAKTPRQLLTSDTLEIVSVASSHHDWSLACGVLGACSRNRLRYALGGSSRKALKNCPEQQDRPKLSVRKPIGIDEEKPLLSPCQPVRRQSTFSPPLRTPRNRGGKLAPESPSRNANAGICRPTASFFPTTDENCPKELSKITHKNIQPSATAADPKLVEKDLASPNKSIPPAKSLSSPFPMQFRERPARNLRSATPSLSISVNTGGVADDASSSTSLDDSVLCRDNQQHPVPETPRSAKMMSMKPMETISGGPLPLVRVASSPSNLTPKWTSTFAAKGVLPPPCPPNARRRVLPTSPSLMRTPMRKQQTRRYKRMMRQMKASKQTARSTSVFDMTEDESDEDDDGYISTSDDDDDQDEADVAIGNENSGTTDNNSDDAVFNSDCNHHLVV